ncbi:MAG TPA: hypothetical protein VG651_24575 [Stellaceae bacterium]|nr:hypothetical protein [Stellaceae bacterium]
MKHYHKRLCAGAVAMSALLTAAAPPPAQAQSEPIPCSAFARGPSGGWQVLSPVMLDLGGRLYSPTVGTVFPAGATQHGIEMSDVLDRQCGNR